MGTVKYKYDAKTNTHYTVIRTNKKPFVLAPFGASKGQCSAVEIAKKYNFDICINAGLFNPREDTYEPEGIIIQNGEVIQNKSACFYPDSMPLTIDINGELGYASADIDAHELLKQGIVSAVCGFMPIVIDYEPVPEDKWTKVPHYTKPHQRQIIGQYDNEDYIIITCEGRGYANSDGWTIKDAQRVCTELGVKFAYNLDGGTSTETVINGIQLNSVYERASNRFASTFICFN